MLELKITDEEQEILHRNDRDTAWFGIVREQGELPLFQDYGRYSTLMTNTSQQEKILNSATVVGGCDTRYPAWSLLLGRRVTTNPSSPVISKYLMIYAGAGKSTIIKLVIDLSTREEHNFATPVVGSVGKDVPTSGDVHLYLDPQTADSEAQYCTQIAKGLKGVRESTRGLEERQRPEQFLSDRINWRKPCTPPTCFSTRDHLGYNKWAKEPWVCRD